MKEQREALQKLAAGNPACVEEVLRLQQQLEQLRQAGILSGSGHAITSPLSKSINLAPANRTLALANKAAQRTA